MSEEKKKKVLSRISIQEDGSLVVTDLWEEVEELLFSNEDGDFEKID